MNNPPHSLPPLQSGPAWGSWLVALAALITLGFAAHAQQQKPEATPKTEGADGPTIDAPAADGPAIEAPAADRDPAAPVEADDAIEQAMQQAEQEDVPVDSQLQEVPAAATNAVVQESAPLPGLALLRRATAPRADGPWLATDPDGKSVQLTLLPQLQRQMNELFKTYKPQGGALVALDPRTGKVLALVEFSSDGKSEGLATRPLYPAASVFKIITGAALLESGVLPGQETCFHGGMHGLVTKLLKDAPRLDRRCLSLSMALAKSANVVFGKLAVRHLDAAGLRHAAERFLFNRPIWSDSSVEGSTAQISGTGLEFAKTAAGFGAVKLSPLHAALIAAAVGNDGLAMRPTLLETVDGQAPAVLTPVRLLRKDTADALTEMMKLTVKDGTATPSFRERRRNVLGDIEVAGKTGSLSSHSRPFKDYSWFVGFAPADNPEIAVAAVVVNGLKWRIHAPYVAREAMRAYFMGGKLGQPPAARAHRHTRAKARRH